MFCDFDRFLSAKCKKKVRWFVRLGWFSGVVQICGPCIGCLSGIVILLGGVRIPYGPPPEQTKKSPLVWGLFLIHGLSGIVTFIIMLLSFYCNPSKRKFF